MLHARDRRRLTLRRRGRDEVTEHEDAVVEVARVLDGGDDADVRADAEPRRRSRRGRGSWPASVVAFSRSSTSLKAARADARRAWSSLFPAAASASAACRRSSNAAPNWRSSCAELGGARAGLDARLVDRVEEHRRLDEQVEREDQDAGEEDQRLQRDLDERAHQQRAAALVDRLRGEVALDLALVAAEVGRASGTGRRACPTRRCTSR